MCQLSTLPSQTFGLVRATGAEYLSTWSPHILILTSPKVDSSSSTQDSSSPRLPQVSEEIHSVVQSGNLGVILQTSLCLTHIFQSSTMLYGFYPLKSVSNLSSPCLHCHEPSPSHHYFSPGIHSLLTGFCLSGLAAPTSPFLYM